MVLSPYARMIAICVALAATVGGLGKTAGAETPPAFVAPVPGSRLVPCFLTGEDESRQFVGWYDATRGESCSFALSGDGVLRCLPTDVVEANRFTDAACTLPMATVSARDKPRYLTTVQAGGDLSRPLTVELGMRHYIYELGRRIQPATVYLHSGAGCVRVTPDPAVSYVALGRSVPPASFVGARYTLGRPSLSLKTEYHDDP
jgi:hypothetical protein